MPVLSIHPQPAQAIERAKAVLESMIDLGEVALGGSVALEARWHHRTTTDLDFFASGGAVDTLFYQFDQLNEHLMDHWEAGRINGKRPSIAQRAVLHFEIDGTRVSFKRVEENQDPSDDSSDDTERLTSMRLSHTRDILTRHLRKTFLDRLGEKPFVTQGDAYDFCVARSLDPESLEYAWSQVTGYAKREVLDKFEGLAGTSESVDESKRVRNPAYPGLLANLWAEALAMFESDLRHIPPLASGQDDQSTAGTAI